MKAVVVLTVLGVVDVVASLVDGSSGTEIVIVENTVVSKSAAKPTVTL
jgi:hypothetical protein